MEIERSYFHGKFLFLFIKLEVLVFLLTVDHLLKVNNKNRNIFVQNLNGKGNSGVFYFILLFLL